MNNKKSLFNQSIERQKHIKFMVFENLRDSVKKADNGYLELTIPRSSAPRWPKGYCNPPDGGGVFHNPANRAI